MANSNNNQKILVNEKVVNQHVFGLREVSRVANNTVTKLGASGGFLLNDKYSTATKQSKDLLEGFKKVVLADATKLAKVKDWLMWADKIASNKITNSDR
jgi:hypothetical protein